MWRSSCATKDVMYLTFVKAICKGLPMSFFSERRIVLTHDSDFGKLAIPNGEPIFGIVYIRPGHLRVEQTLGTLRALLTQDFDLTPPFLIVAKRIDNNVTFRLRSL